MVKPVLFQTFLSYILFVASIINCRKKLIINYDDYALQLKSVDKEKPVQQNKKNKNQNLLKSNKIFMERRIHKKIRKNDLLAFFVLKYVLYVWISVNAFIKT